jgi:hypothetical protein
VLISRVLIVVCDNFNTCNATEWDCKQNSIGRVSGVLTRWEAQQSQLCMNLVVIVCPTATFEGGGGSVV